MEQESFADPGLAALLNAHVLSIKVDREQRPDLDAWYSRVVETVQGETGWPITVLLTPAGQPLFAANYLTREQLATAVERYSGMWREQPSALERSAAALQDAVRTALPLQDIALLPADPAWITQARDRLLADVDASDGGFGSGPKFPDEVKWQFLLDAWKADRDPQLHRLLVAQLDALMASALADPVFGGVFRYTTDRQRSRPHFEKMLYNQALMVSLYSDAARWLQRPQYREFADTIIRFVNATLRLPDGGFASAVDADHGGVEGAYYLWPQAAVADLPAGLIAVPFADDQWLVHGKPATDAGRQWLSQLAATRREPPRVTGNEITAWNALWIRALLDAGQTQAAIALAAHTWARAWDGAQLLRMGGQAGFLDDHAYLSDALWRLYLETGEVTWKTRAGQLDRAMARDFIDSQGLGYRQSDPDGVGGIRPDQDSEWPSPVAAALLALTRHPADADFAAASASTRVRVHAALAQAPERHLSLLQALWPPSAAAAVIAQGHGMVALRPGENGGDWLLELHLDEGWHVNANSVPDKYLVPTRVEAAADTVVASYPPGSPLQTGFSETALNVYSGGVTIVLRGVPLEQPLEVLLQTQACNERVCLLPEQHLLRQTAPQAND
jgi:uncharacterized protein YyaL (SSP411 family)